MRVEIVYCRISGGGQSPDVTGIAREIETERARRCPEEGDRLGLAVRSRDIESEHELRTASGGVSCVGTKIQDGKVPHHEGGWDAIVSIGLISCKNGFRTKVRSASSGTVCGDCSAVLLDHG